MKKIVAILTTILMIACLSGCGLVPSLDLTESEQKVIAEYAAGLLLKHDRNYSGSLMELEEEEEEVQIVAEPTAAPVYEEPALDDDLSGQNSENPDFSEDLEASGGEVTSEQTYSDLPMADVIGLDGFTVMYKNYELHDIYPESQDGDLVFSLEAQPGNKLLVMNFAITNDCQDRMLCDVLNSEASFKILVNGNKQINASNTILLNDLAAYYEEIDGYGMADAVIICEMPADLASDIQTLDLKIKKGQQYNLYSLR